MLELSGQAARGCRGPIRRYLQPMESQRDGPNAYSLNFEVH